MDAELFARIEIRLLVILSGLVLANVLVAMLWLKAWSTTEYYKRGGERE